MRPLLISIAVLSSSLAINLEAKTQSYQCPDGRLVETKVKGSREQRKKTANLQINEVKQQFSELPGWLDKPEPESLLQVIENNCKTSKLPKGWEKVCQESEGLNSANVYDYIENNFVPYQLVVDTKTARSDKGKFTSYYASYVNVSKTKTDKYQHPIYKFSKKRKLYPANKLKLAG